MSAVTARGAVLRPVASPERAERKPLAAPRAIGLVLAIGHRVRQAFTRGIEPTSAALALSDPEQIRRLVPPARAVDDVRWALASHYVSGVRR